MSNNVVSLTGRICGEVKVNKTSNGSTVCRLSLSTSDYDFKEKKYKPTYHSVVVWGKQAEYVEKHVKRGDLISASGKLGYSKWTDKQGVEKTQAEITANEIVKHKFFPSDEEDSRESSKREAEYEEEIPF